MNLIPKTTRLVIRETSSRPTSEQISGADHIFLLSPKLIKQQKWSKLPFQSTIDHLLVSSTNKSGVLFHAGDPGTASLTFSQYDSGMSPFEILTLARNLFATLNQRQPKRAIFLCNDKSAQVRSAFADAICAAGHAWLCSPAVFKSRKPTPKKLRNLDIYGSHGLNIARLKAEANGNNLARVLAALPPNILDGKTYIQTVRQFAKDKKWSFKLLDQKRLESLGAGAFLAVAQGNPPDHAGIVRLRRTGKQKRPWVSLVGKGVCFDTGGVNLKNASGMQEMQEDMQGSSVALGTFSALCDLCPDKTIECWLAITENRINANAYTPTEIVTASNGTSIEVVHTDAEGRMALADTLYLASKNKPQLMIDYATLTGACVYALTSRYSGAFTSCESMHPAIQMAGRKSGERVWSFPIDKDFDSMLKSDYADIKQCSLDGKGDHIAAARFLSKFVTNDTPWIHMDLSSGHHKGGLAHVTSDITGVGVRFTCNLLLDQNLHEIV